MVTTIRKSAGEVLDHFAVKPSELNLIDDPPGKLKAIRFTTKRRNKTTRVEVRLRYTLELFSADRSWTPDSIRSAEVEAIEPTDAW